MPQYHNCGIISNYTREVISMSKRILALVLSGVLLLSTGCGLSSKTKNRIFGDKWVTYHMTWAINNGNSDYLAQLIQENKDNEDLLNDALTMALAETLTFKNRAFMVEQLLDAGADPNTESSTGESVLITYLYNYKGCFDTTAALLTSNNIDLSVKGDTGKDVLITAMSTGNSYEYCSYYQVQMLVKAGAKPTQEIFQKDSVWSEPYGHLKDSPYSTKYLLNILLENGEESGLPLSLEYALLGDSDNAIKEIEKTDKDLDEDQKRLFAWYIMYWGTPEQFEKVSDMWELDFSKYYILPSIAQTNNVDMLKYMIEKTDLDITGSDDDSDIILDIFNYAAVMENSEVCEYLIENDCLTETEYRPRKSLLSNALSSQNFDIFKMVFNYMNSMEQLNEEEIDESLNDAFKNRIYNEPMSEFYRKVVDFLFDNGYNLENINIWNLNYEGYKYITEKGRPVSNQDLFDAMDETDIKMFKFAVENGADINSLNPRLSANGLEKSVIKDAVQTGDEFVSLLIDKNVELPEDILKVTTDSTSDTLKLLIDNGANTDIEITQIPASTKGDVKSGDYDLKDYWEAYGRDDLAELL